ncbi:transcription factor UNE10-like [Lycium ferocissimum]|uniref:transcription factor UNE10-like n=1 Tax=Lycium ferocissimum TaxID=112874 RepID=UPI002814C6F2|nr:transcription factor UNE10-like [Lycium ferocissimum]
MNQCVPSWELDDSPPHLNLALSSHSNSNNSFVTDVPSMDYEVAELTWENGQLAMHGLGPPRVPNKPLLGTWDNKMPHAGGTLESIVNQATGIPPRQQKSGTVDGAGDGDRGDDLVRWFDNCLADTQTATTTMAVDALVPTNSTNTGNSHQLEPKCIASRSIHVASCSGVANRTDEEMKRAKTGAKDLEITESLRKGEVKNLIESLYEGHNMADRSVSRRDTIETGERHLGEERLTSTSMASPDRSTSKLGRAQDEDEKKGSKISLFSTKRSRAAATHNQSERKRRDKINQRMKTLQKLVPTSSKTDKASMLDEVIEYLKQLQAQVDAMSKMRHVNMSPAMMLPNMALQQQHLQMSMAAQSAMGMGGMGMAPNITAMPSVLHSTTASFIPIGDSITAASAASVVPDPLASFRLACQSQPMTVDAYRRMAALYQQQYLQSHANLGFKN